MPADWSQSTASDTDWFLTDTYSTDGLQSMRAGDIADNQESIIEYRNLFAAGNFNFKAKVDSEGCCDSLEIYADDIYLLRITGNEWQSKSIELSSGEHVIKFRYQKDSSVSSGLDTAWIDEVEFIQL